MTPIQLKAWIKNKSKKSGIPADLLMRSYMMGKLVEKISQSDYQANFVLKGGFLLGSILGVENRATMDLDTTIQELKGTRDTIEQVLDDIFITPTSEGIEFSLKSLKEIRDADFYPGFRANLFAKLGNMPIDLKIDITIGDSIYPEAMRYRHELMFEEKHVELYAYSVEQIIAEKFHAALYLEETNTRARDFYDVYMLSNLKQMNAEQLERSMRATFNKRGMPEKLSSYIDETWPILESSSRLESIWNRYSQSTRNPYAKDISFREVMSAASNLLEQVKRIEQQRESGKEN